MSMSIPSSLEQFPGLPIVSEKTVLAVKVRRNEIGPREWLKEQRRQVRATEPALHAILCYNSAANMLERRDPVSRARLHGGLVVRHMLVTQACDTY